MKYDTFRGMSGKLSFSIALLDGDDSGFVLSSMHTQDAATAIKRNYSWTITCNTQQ